MVLIMVLICGASSAERLVLPLISEPDRPEPRVPVWSLYLFATPGSEADDLRVYLNLYENGDIIYTDAPSTHDFPSPQGDKPEVWLNSDMYLYNLPQTSFDDLVTSFTIFGVFDDPGKSRGGVTVSDIPYYAIQGQIYGLGYQATTYHPIFESDPEYFSGTKSLIRLPAGLTQEQYLAQEETAEYRRWREVWNYVTETLTSLIPPDNTGAVNIGRPDVTLETVEVPPTQ